MRYLGLEKHMAESCDCAQPLRNFLPGQRKCSNGKEDWLKRTATSQSSVSFKRNLTPGVAALMTLHVQPLCTGGKTELRKLTRRVTWPPPRYRSYLMPSISAHAIVGQVLMTKKRTRSFRGESFPKSTAHEKQKIQTHRESVSVARRRPCSTSSFRETFYVLPQCLMSL